MANDYSAAAATTPIYHINTDPTSLFEKNLCLRCKNIDQYGKTDQILLTNIFYAGIQCKGGIDISMPDAYYGTQQESDQVNSLIQTQHVSTDPNLRPKFNFTSFYTTTKACPVDFYQISTDFYDPQSATNNVDQSFYNYPPGIVPKSFTDNDESKYLNTEGPIDIDESPSPTTSGTVSNGKYYIEVEDGKTPAEYKFKIKAWVLENQIYHINNPTERKLIDNDSTYVTQFLTLRTICPTFTGNTDEVESITLSDHTTWIGAPPSQSTYSLDQPFRPTLPKCNQIIEYSAILESAQGVLSYPSSSCTTIPCESWDINTSVAYPSSSPFTFKIEAKSNHGFTYQSGIVQITILENNDAQPQIQPTTVPTQWPVFYIGEISILEIDKFTESVYGLKITNYILTTDTTRLSQNLLSPGCGSFLTTNIQGTTQPNGKIGFNIDTSSMVSNCQTVIYAETELYSNIFDFTQIFSIFVECGQETISLHPSISQPQEILFYLGQTITESPYSLTNFNNSGTPIFISSQQVMCPINNSKFSRDLVTQGCTPQAGSQVTLSGSDLIFDSSKGLQETICIKAETDKNSISSTLFRLQVTVCGLESLTIALLQDSHLTHLLQQGEQKQISYDDSWFAEDFTNSKPWCVQTRTYELKTGSNCQDTASPLHFLIDTVSKTITLTASDPIQSTTLCLKASTKGNVVAYQKLQVEFCGDEQIIFSKMTNFSNTLTFERQFGQVKNLSLNDIRLDFQSSRVNCPIYYELIQNVNGVSNIFTGQQISLESTSGLLSIDTSQPMNFKGFILAYSFNQNAFLKSEFLEFKVCGYESIDTNKYQFYYVMDKNIGVKTTILNLLEIAQNVNDTDCSFYNSFKLVDQNNLQVLSGIQGQKFRLDGNQLIVNTNLDLETAAVAFFIQGTTKGLRQFYFQLTIQFREVQFKQSDREGEQNMVIEICLNEEDKCANSWKEIIKITPYIGHDVESRYYDMLKYIFLPSITFKWPDPQPENDSFRICEVYGSQQMELARMNSVIYSANNPDSQLPLDEMIVAAILYVYIEVHGLNEKGEHCTQTIEKNFQKDLVTVKGLSKTIDERYNIIDVIKSANKEISQQKVEIVVEDKNVETIQRMKLTGINIKREVDNSIILDVGFDKALKPLKEQEINKLHKVFNLFVYSAIDQSSIKGVWAPKQFNRKLSQNTSLDEPDQELQYRQSDYFVSWSFQQLQFHWGPLETQEQSLRFKLEFQYPYNVSNNNFGKDQIQLSIKENTILCDSEHGLPMNNTQFGKNIRTNLKSARAKPVVEEQIQSSVKAFSFAVFALQSSSIYKNLVLSKSLQDVWGIINTQIIVIHMILFKCLMTTPRNIYTFNSFLSQLAQKDMYPTDQIYGAIFNFKDEDSPVEHFEFLGYEGVIFITLSGSIIINLLITLFIWVIIQLTVCLVKKYPHSKLLRSIGVYFGHKDLTKVITALYNSSFIELVFSALISIIGLSSPEYQGDNPSNIISQVFMMISLLIMIVNLFSNLYASVKYRGNLENPEIQQRYGFIYDGIKTDKFITSIFQFIFMVRRIVFVLIIILLKEYSGMQLILNTFLTLAYIMYLTHFRPYKEVKQNKRQIFNDVCTMMVSYFMMWFAIFPDYSEEEMDAVDTIGWFYIFTASFNIVANCLNLAYQFVLDLPKLIRKQRQKLQEFQYKRWKNNYIQKQKNLLKNKHASNQSKYFAAEATKIENYENFKLALTELQDKQAKETQWFSKVKLNDERYKEFIESQHQTEQYELRQKYFKPYNPTLGDQKMMELELDVNDMLPVLMPHNNPQFIIDGSLFPYKEQTYLAEKDNILKSQGELTDEKIKQFNRKINSMKQEHLLFFLEHQKYYFVKNDHGSNCIPIVIALIQFRMKQNWKQVREDVYNHILKNFKEQHKDKENSSELKGQLKKFGSIKNSKQRFAMEELQACATLYNLSFVIFSLQNKMRFMDLLIQPKQVEKKNCSTIYLLHHCNELTVLVHRIQPRLRRLFEKKGLTVKRFRLKNLLADDDQLIKDLNEDNLFTQTYLSVNSSESSSSSTSDSGSSSSDREPDQSNEQKDLGLVDNSKLLGQTFFHNDPKLLIGKPPFQEERYLQIQNKYQSGKIMTKVGELLSAKELEKVQASHLMTFLEQEKYWVVQIEKDGNCGPRVVSLRVHGNQNSHLEVRSDICDFMREKLQMEFLYTPEDPDYKIKMEVLEKMAEGGTWFTDKELQVCCNLYGFPIIVFSIANQMLFFDNLILSSSAVEKQDKGPLYILSHENHFTALIHREQQELQEFFQTMGSQVQKFKASHFLPLEDEEIENRNKKTHRASKLLPAKTKRKLNIYYQVMPNDVQAQKKNQKGTKRYAQS